MCSDVCRPMGRVDMDVNPSGSLLTCSSPEFLWERFSRWCQPPALPTCGKEPSSLPPKFRLSPRSPAARHHPQTAPGPVFAAQAVLEIMYRTDPPRVHSGMLVTGHLGRRSGSPPPLARVPFSLPLRVRGPSLCPPGLPLTWT